MIMLDHNLFSTVPVILHITNVSAKTNTRIHDLGRLCTKHHRDWKIFSEIAERDFIQFMSHHAQAASVWTLSPSVKVSDRIGISFLPCLLDTHPLHSRHLQQRVIQDPQY